MDKINPAILEPVLKWGGIGLMTIAIFIAILSAFGNPNSFIYRYWARYISSLERKLRPMFIFTPGRHIAIGQLVVIFVIIAASFVTDLPLPPVWLIAAALLPTLYIDSQKKKRTAQIESQLDSFILALANALKAIPSIGAAFQSVVPILQPPIKDEIDLATKEMKVGSSLDQALLHMASRIGSRQIDSALSAILIGRQIGGNLGRVLESSAASIREMSRLEGVLRTKTADGRMQLWVIGALPFGLVVLLSIVSPGYFEPMQKSSLGLILISIAVGAWITALFVARKVLAVDY